jgi:hypothetical protein
VVSLASIPFAASAQSAPLPRVVSYSLTDRAPARWSVGAKPLLEIGGIDGVGPTELSGITGVTRQQDGTLVVANAATRELRFFDARGRFSRSATRSGQGPGEIADLTRMLAIDDTLVVVDNRLELHVYAPSGKWLRTVILPPIPNYLVNPAFGLFSAVDVVMPLRGGITESERRNRDNTIRVDSVWFARVSLRDTSVRVLVGERRPPNYSLTPGRPDGYGYALGFAPQPLAAAARDRICVGYPERYDVTCADTLGRPLFRIVRATTRRPVTDSARRAFRDAQAGRLPDGTSRYEGSLRKHRERVAAAAKFASHYPAYSQVLLSRSGDLWVRAFATEHGVGAVTRARTTWSIYDRSGRWIAECTLPPRFALMEVGNDYVVGVSRDEDDVERVTLLSLRR